MNKSGGGGEAIRACGPVPLHEGPACLMPHRLSVSVLENPVCWARVAFPLLVLSIECACPCLSIRSSVAFGQGTTPLSLVSILLVSYLLLFYCFCLEAGVASLSLFLCLLSGRAPCRVHIWIQGCMVPHSHVCVFL